MAKLKELFVIEDPTNGYLYVEENKSWPRIYATFEIAEHFRKLNNEFVEKWKTVRFVRGKK